MPKEKGKFRKKLDNSLIRIQKGQYFLIRFQEHLFDIFNIKNALFGLILSSFEKTQNDKEHKYRHVDHYQ